MAQFLRYKNMLIYNSRHQLRSLIFFGNIEHVLPGTSNKIERNIVNPYYLFYVHM